MKNFILPILFAAGLAATFARSEGGPAREASPAAIAAALIPGYASSARPADLTTLYRLQLAEQHFTDAEKTLDRLEQAYQSSEPRLVPALVPWRIYARAKAYAASGTPAGDALGRAFSELYATLPDNRVADILPWYGADFDRLRAEVSEQERPCAGKPLASCPSAAGLIASHEALAAWVYLLPASESLIKADLQRRFLIDDRILIPTPDGVTIAAMLVRPRSLQPVKLTALLNFTIYARDDWSIGDAVQMAGHGYAGVVAYTRGKGRSSGPVAPYVHDGEDAATVIAWLARQPWSDADVHPAAGQPDTRNALVFETDPLTKPLEVDGLFRGRLGVVINKRDFDLSVRFYELRPDGRYFDLASYLGRASYMQDRTHRHLLEPGQPRILEFESQTLTARRLARGSRIVAVVGVPKSQINYGTGRNVSDESIADAGKPLVVRWSAGSYLDIGVR